MDRVNCGRGGLRICEVIIFTDNTNNVERAEAIHAYLRKKWLNIGDGALTGSTLEDITLENDATLTLNNDVTFNADTKLSANLASTGATTLTINGKLTILEGATLTLNIDADMLKSEGEWSLISATEVVGASNLTVTLADGTNVAGNWKAKWVNGTLKLVMSKSGMMMIVR